MCWARCNLVPLVAFLRTARTWHSTWRRHIRFHTDSVLGHNPCTTAPDHRKHSLQVLSCRPHMYCSTLPNVLHIAVTRKHGAAPRGLVTINTVCGSCPVGR